MLTYTDLRTRYGDNTNNDETTNLDKGSRVMNDIYRRICRATSWRFLEKQETLTTVASQQAYDLPNDVDKVTAISVTNGSTKYSLEEVTGWEQWETLNASTSFTSSIPTHYFINGEDNQLELFPTPSASSDDITVSYQKKFNELSLADYSTGTIVSIANGDTTVTGDSTVWTAGMVGGYIKITKSFAAGYGDGVWYKIASVTSNTVLELDREYQGTSIATGSATYKIGEVSVLPEDYHSILVDYASWIFWLKNDSPSRADRFKQNYEEMFKQLIEKESTKTNNIVIESFNDYDLMKNPNFYITQ